ncbi:phosphatidylinositol-specific phospholipase C domain-containing protein [Flavobacterium sp.]|uniref:phosphatidylinositol-specific phospholipase C domain-containing protein n=1 Tax=Flavobacterium sp. TaxID=239 RepID=UPI0040479957
MTLHSQNGNNWMGSVNGSTKVSDLDIPGTHDSATYTKSLPYVQTQRLSINEQLNAGVRFLDIRCRYFNGDFSIHHGPIYLNLNFQQVLDMCKTFLRNNPTETIIMSVKQEQSNDRYFPIRFQQYVSANPGLFLQTSTIPTLNEAKGKIVLFRRFSGGSFGIQATNFPDDTYGTYSNNGISMDIQDVYSYRTGWDIREKEFTEKYLIKARFSTSDFVLNYSSGFAGLGGITTVSGEVNRFLYNYFNHPLAKHVRNGYIIMDFPNVQTIRNIYMCNMVSNKKKIVKLNKDCNGNNDNDILLPQLNYSYKIDDFNWLGIKNDELSYIDIYDRNAVVRLYEHGYFSGSSRDMTYYNTGSCLTSQSFNDKTSSIIVRITGNYSKNSNEIDSDEIDYDKIDQTNNLLQTDDIKVFLNPNENVINIENSMSNIRRVTLYDLAGKQILDKVINEETFKYKIDLNLINTNQGIILIKIMDENGNIHNKKILIK